MLANIVLLRRLPKAFDTFTYLVPTELESQILVGQLVQIPFRNSQTIGIVFSLEDAGKKTLNKKIKPVSQILFPDPFLPESFLLFLQKVGKIYGVALSTLFENALPDMTVRTLKQLKAPLIPTKDVVETLPLYKKYTSSEEHKEMILDSLHGQTLILLPEKQYLKTLFDFLPTSLQKQTVMWHGDLKATEKRKVWCEIRNKEKNIILSTRSGVLLPLCQLDTIIVDYEQHREHKNAEQAPRFQVKDMTPLICEYSGAREIYMSYSPSIESYYSLYKGGYQNENGEETLHFGKLPEEQLPRIMNMKDERKGGNNSPLCEELERNIVEASGDIFLFINRKGAGSVLICKDCRYEEKCTQCDLPFVHHAEKKLLICHYCKVQKPVPLSCVKCGSVVLEFKGVGTESVEKRVRELLKNSKKNVVRIEGEEEVNLQNENVGPKVIIGTEKAFEYVKWNTTSLVAMLDLDRQLSLPEFKASECAWDLIQEIQYFRSLQSQFFIQTLDTKQLLIKSLREPDRFYRTNLNTRQSLGYPPYRFLVRYFYGDVNADIALREAKKVCFDLEQFLTKEQKKATITGPIELQPKYSRGRFWYGIIIKLEKKNWYEGLCEINSLIPAGWKIDPNPNTLLHP